MTQVLIKERSGQFCGEEMALEPNNGIPREEIKAFRSELVRTLWSVNFYYAE